MSIDAKTIFGLHDAGGEEILLAAGRPGWILISEAIGCDPNNRAGKEYSSLAEQGMTVIVRLNHGYYPHGTLPANSEYVNFARRCANFVAASPGCHHWIIGNEMNYAVERPGVGDLVVWDDEGDPYLHGLPQRFNALHAEIADPEHAETVRLRAAGDLITPESYARVYRLCRNAIRLIPGHADDRVLMGAVCPWNTHTVYPGNPRGDWLKYFQDILLLVGPNECDGLTLHAYTHGANPALIVDESGVNGFAHSAYHFQIYRDFMEAIPHNMRHLPVYITEADQGQPWENSDTGWIRAAYAEIERWNQQAETQKIGALILYRWSYVDRWHLEDKNGLLRDLEAALGGRRTTDDQRQTADSRQQAANIPQYPISSPQSPIYRVQWIGGQMPRALYAGEVIRFPVTLRNLGSVTWAQTGSDPIYLGYRVYQNHEEIALPTARRIPLPADVPPDGSVTVQAELLLPSLPGNYTIDLDLFGEESGWFQAHESDVLVRWVTVYPQPTKEEGRLTADDRRPTADDDESPNRQSSIVNPQSPIPDPRSPIAPIPITADAPEIVDVRGQLPRSNLPYLHRRLDQIRYLVINHTGAPPVLPLAAIAQAHLERGYAGVAYDYLITAGGTILHLHGLDEAVSEAEWSLGGVNIALEGNFHEAIPVYEQIEATAHLCAWLIGQVPDLAEERIVGLRELIPSSSPGNTFLEAPGWRRLLRERVAVRLHRDENLYSQPPLERAAPAVASRPPIHEITTGLPRDPLGFYSRQPADIRLIVINHTAVAPDVSVEQIADAFRGRGLPGILYQYYIAEDGAIYQTQPLLQVVDGEKPYIANAINIAFAGDFDNAIPTPEQLAAGGALIAWLLAEYPHLQIDDVKGVSEFISHNSPGDQWLFGRRWKDLLLQAVQIAPERSAPTLQGRAVADQQARLQQFQEENDSLYTQMSGLRAENERLHREVEMLRADTRRVSSVPEPRIIDAVDGLPRHPSLRYDDRRLGAITHIAIHHTAVPAHIGPNRIAELHISEDASRGKRPWPGIGYHFFVHADGRLVRTQPLERIAYHVAGHNEYTVGIVFAGSFMNGIIPTPEQITAGAHLLAWLMQELRVPLQHVWGHREFSDNHTQCPGSEWLGGQQWRDLLYEEIVRLQRGE